MKRVIFQIISYSFIAILGTVILSGCTKEQPTDLQIIVVDGNGNKIQGATVNLLDHTTQAQIGASLVTDANGQVTFMNLNPIVYDWFASIDCQNNYNTTYTTTNPLVAHKTGTFTSTLSTTANLIFNNVSGDSYKISVDGNTGQTLAGNSSVEVTYVPAGTHKIEVTQIGGSVDQIYTTTLACDQDATISFPQFFSLQITVDDVNYNPVQGATVNLYQHNSSTVIATLTTDVNGQVTFTNLNSIVYDWLAVSGCQNSYNSSYTTTNPLSPNITKTVTTTIATTANIIFQNVSSDPYNIYVDGKLYQTISGNSSITESYVPAGTHAVEVIQQSGYVNSPTDETFNATISCNQNATVAFP